jgi:hypothetical protein
MKIKAMIPLGIFVILGCNGAVGVEQGPGKFTPVQEVIKPEKPHGIEAHAASFDDMVVRHAKRRCREDFSTVFSNDSRDFIDFWATAQEINLNLEKAYTCLRLFFNNIKLCEAIDASVVDQVIDAAPRLFERYFEIAAPSTENLSRMGELNYVRESIEDLMLKRFTDQFDQFQAAPDLFLEKLSRGVIDVVKLRLNFMRKEEEEFQYREKLRMTIVRFIDLMLSKTLWSTNVWPLFISISDNLHKLGVRKILNEQDNLDELWDTLVKRFVYYIDLRGSAFPVAFYDQIERDLNNNVVLCFNAPEQDDGIKTKKELIREAIIRGKAKAIAAEKGFVTDQQSQSFKA